jgi:hypothetical protein
MDGHGWARLNYHFLSFVPPWRLQIVATGVWQRRKGAEWPFSTDKRPINDPKQHENGTKLTLFYLFFTRLENEWKWEIANVLKGNGIFKLGSFGNFVFLKKG